MEVEKTEKSKVQFRPNQATILMFVIIFVAAILRLYNLSTESYWIDEMSTVTEGQQTFHQLLTVGRLDQPPAYYLPFHLWIQIFGLSETGTRSFSVLIGVLCIILTYLVGRELFGEQVGILSAFLMAISEFQISYSQMARFYIFFEFTTLLSFLFFILSLKSKKTVFFVLYVVASAAMICSHAYGLFIIAVQNLFIAIFLKRYKDILITWVICQVSILIAIIPYFSPLLFGSAGLQGEISENVGGGNLDMPTLRDPIRSIYHFIFSARRDRSWEVMITNYLIAVAVLTIGVAVHYVRMGKTKISAWVHGMLLDIQHATSQTHNLLLVVIWFLIPIALPFILSFIIAPLYKSYYTISAAPAFYLLIALGLLSIRKVVPLFVSLMVLMIMTVPSLQQYYVTDINEQWKEVALYIEENSKQEDIIVLAPDMGDGMGTQQRIFNLYYRGSLERCGISNDSVDPIIIAGDIKQCISGHRRFWTIVYGTPESNTFDRYQTFFNGNYIDVTLIEEEEFNTLNVYLFEIKD